MMSLEDHLLHHNFLHEPSVEVAPFQAIHSCLEHIWQELHLRARLFICKGEELILRDYVGTYGCCPEIGLKVHPGSVVWEVFRQGKAVNLKEVNKQEERPCTLPEPVAIKAVIPLTVLDISSGEQQTVGALVVDAGDSPEPIQDRDFHYLQVVGMLISEILERFICWKGFTRSRGRKTRWPERWRTSSGTVLPRLEDSLVGWKKTSLILRLGGGRRSFWTRF